MIEKEHYKGYTIRYVQDEYSENPIDENPFGTIIHWHRCYKLGHQRVTHEEAEDLIRGAISLPVYMYDHSGVTIRTTAFSYQWDSGQVGYIYASPEKIREEFGCKYLTKKIKEQVYRLLASEIETYDAYLRGAVYEWRIYKEGSDEALRTCGGYIIANQECETFLTREAHQAVDSLFENQLTALAKEMTMDTLEQFAA